MTTTELACRTENQMENKNENKNKRRGEIIIHKHDDVRAR